MHASAEQAPPMAISVEASRSLTRLLSFHLRSFVITVSTLLCFFIAHILYRYSSRKWGSQRTTTSPPSLSTTQSKEMISFSFLSRIQQPFQFIFFKIRFIIWDSCLFPLLAWVLNLLAVLFAIVFSFVPAMLSQKNKNFKVCVPTLPSVSSKRNHSIDYAEATQLNRGKPAPTLSPYFSALMVPSALSCTRKRKSLVLDLDETLVHSQFRLTEHCDLRLVVRVDQFPTVFYVSKRPYLDVFLRTVAQWYDIVIFTASLQKYGDPLITVLDTDNVVKRRIFRQDCIKRNGNFVKDLTIVNPNLADVLIVDNSPAAYSIQPSNAVPIETWYHDQNDEELLNLLPLLHAIAFLTDVRSLLDLRLTGGNLAARRGRSLPR